MREWSTVLTLFVLVGLADGDHFDLDEGTLGQVAHGEGRTAGEGLLKEFGVYLVHGTKVGDVAQQHSSFDNVVQTQTLSL